MTNPLVYVPTAIPDDGIFKISPSAFSTFIQKPHEWYRSEVLGVDKFTYNTSTVLGTIVHYCAHMVSIGEDVDKKAIEEYIDSFKVVEGHDFDPAVVRYQYTNMAERLVNDYVLGREFLEVETSHCAEIRNGYYAAGKIDELEGTKEDCLIGDYKSYSSKTTPKSIPMHYKYQLLVYAWILTQLKYNPTRMRLIYINRHIEGEMSPTGNGKQLKSYPPEVTVLTENIENEDIEFIGSLLHLAVDSCEASKTHPELTHVIWHDPRLKAT